MEELQERIHAEGLREASTFSTVEEAVACIDLALQERSQSIHTWLRAGQHPMHRITVLLAAPTGLVATRSPRQTMPGSTIRVVLRRDDNKTPPFYVETAFLVR